jgi:hypothetical protein
MQKLRLAQRRLKSCVLFCIKPFLKFNPWGGAKRARSKTSRNHFKKATQILLLYVALSSGCDQPQSRLRHVRVEPRVFCCDLLLALASTLHMAICGGWTVTRPRPKPLNADATRVANSGECKNELSYILADAIGSGSAFLHPERWTLDPSHVCMHSSALSECSERIAYSSQGRLP